MRDHNANVNKFDYQKNKNFLLATLHKKYVKIQNLNNYNKPIKYNSLKIQNTYSN